MTITYARDPLNQFDVSIATLVNLSDETGPETTLDVLDIQTKALRFVLDHTDRFIIEERE